jgi:hypothetical protein
MGNVAIDNLEFQIPSLETAFVHFVHIDACPGSFRSEGKMSTNVLPTTNPLPTAPGEETRPSSPKPEIDNASHDQPRGRTSLITRARGILDQDVDNKRTDWVSIYACLLTGFTASISFSVSLPWLRGVSADVRHVSFGVDSKRMPIQYSVRFKLIVQGKFSTTWTSYCSYIRSGPI